MSRHSDMPRDEDLLEVCAVRITDERAVERVARALPSGARTSATSAIFSAMADPTRLRILMALSSEPLCVCDVAAVVGVSESAVSHQLRVLRDRGLVEHRREGQRAVYRLADDHVRDLLSVGLDHADERP